MIHFLLGFLLGFAITLVFVFVIGILNVYAKTEAEKHRTELEKLLREKQ
jgi:hypothetical protein